MGTSYSESIQIGFWELEGYNTNFLGKALVNPKRFFFDFSYHLNIIPCIPDVRVG